MKKLRQLKFAITVRIALTLAFLIRLRVRLQYPFCKHALNVWPTTGAGTPGTAYSAQGVTTIRWGTKDLITTTGWLVVTRFTQKTLVENIKLPNGDGITATRIQLMDGQQWDVTVRDDTAMVPPQIGDTVAITDAGGLIGAGTIYTTTLRYTATVIETGYDAAPKQPGERTITLENLLLVESQTAV